MSVCAINNVTDKHKLSSAQKMSERTNNDSKQKKETSENWEWMKQQTVWVTNTATAKSPGLQAAKSSDNVLEFSLV